MFFKRRMQPDDAFKVVMVTTADYLRRTGRLPGNEEACGEALAFIDKQGFKVDPSQFNTLKCCGLLMEMPSFQSQVRPLYERFNREFPSDVSSAQEIHALMASHGVSF